MSDSSHSHTISLQKLKDTLKLYISSKNKRSVLVEKVINLMNKRSYFSKEVIYSTLGNAVSPTLISADLDAELYDGLTKIIECSKEIGTVIEDLQNYKQCFNACDSPEFPVDTSFYNRLVDQLNKQNMLEDNICETLHDQFQTPISQDALVTMIACFKYTPYCKESEINLILQS